MFNYKKNDFKNLNKPMIYVSYVDYTMFRVAKKFGEKKSFENNRPLA